MPVKPNDLDKTKKSTANGFVKGKDQPDAKTPDKAKHIDTTYGIGQRGHLNTAQETTDAQEYKADGLPKTDQYTVDKTDKNKT